MILSIIIVNYNVEHFLHQCLKSIEKARSNMDIEILVIDNNSVDNSIEMLKKSFPYVKLISNNKNYGFSKANNQGIKQAKGKYILLLNPDTIIQENTLFETINFLRNNSEVGALGVKMIDGTGRFLPESKRSLPTPLSAFYKIFGFSKLFPKSKRFGKYHLSYLDDNIIHEIDVISGAFFLTKKNILDKIGMLDERFFMYGEDIDLSYRIQKNGYQNFYFPKTTIIHYKGESTKKTSINYIITFYNAMSLFVKKHYSIKKARPLLIAINIAIFIRASMSMLKQFILKIIQPLIDTVTIFTGIYLLKNIWATKYFLNQNYYNDNFLKYIVPLYIFFWISSIYLQNGYNKPLKPFNTIKGVLLGSLVLLIIYALLPEKLRFSRALLLLGSIWTAFSLLTLRYLLAFTKIHIFKTENIKNKRVAIVAEETEFQRIKKIIYNATSHQTFIRQINTLKKTDDSFGHINQLEEIIKIHKINEIIFSAEDINSNEIIKYMKIIDNKIDIKISPSESTFIIGSNSIHRKGDLYILNNNNQETYSIKKFFN